MYFKIFISLLFLISAKSVSSQYNFKGRVTNFENNSIVENATITINNKQFLFTDSKGNFEFNFEKEAVSLLIECIGFKKKKEIIYSNNITTIQLTPNISNLDDVTVYSGANKIILKAIEKIKINYPQKNFQQCGFFTFKSSEIQEVPKATKQIKVEALLKVNYTPYKNNASAPTIDLIANKIEQFISEIKLNDSINWTHSWYYPVKYDIVHNRDLFLDVSSLSKYNFILNRKIKFEGNMVYEITFNGKRESMPSGYLYIDTATYAISLVKYISKNIKELFYVDIKKSEIEVKYKKNNSLWILDYIKRDNIYEKFHKITGSNAIQFYKTIDEKLNDSSFYKKYDSPPNILTKQLNEFDEIRSISNINWSKYDTISKKIFESGFPDKIIDDTPYTIKYEKNTNQTNNKILNYLRSNKVSFGFSFSNITNPFLVSKNATFTQNLTFNIYQRFSLNVDISNNFSIGDYSIYRNYLYFSYTFIQNKKYAIDALFGTSNLNIKNKKTNNLSSNNYITSGFRIQNQISKHIFGIVEFNSSDLRFKDHIETIGIILKK